jgi:hypothetical protein
MAAPKAFLYGQGDTRIEPEDWITPRHLEALDKTSAQLREAGFEPKVLQRPLIQSQQQGWNAMQEVEETAKPGDLLVPVCTGWGLPGISEHMFNRVRKPLASGDLKVHFQCNLLPQFPGFVLASALTQILAERGIPFTKTIILDWNDKKPVEELTMLRERGTIERNYGDAGPGEVSVTAVHKKAAEEIDRRLAGRIYGGIGVSSMLMPQGYINRQLLAELGMSAYDIGACEFLETADAVPMWRAKIAFQFCKDAGLEIDPDVAEEKLLRQMQYLVAMETLRVKYGLGFMGYQGQFDLTRRQVADDFATAAMNSRCRPFSDGLAWVMSTEKDFFAAVTMIILQVAVEVVYGSKGESVDFHDLRHLVQHVVEETKKWLIVLLNSGALNFRALTGRDDTQKGVRAKSQNPGYFPEGGAATAGEMVSLDGITYPVKDLSSDAKVYTWARAISLGRQGFCLQAGRGDIIPITRKDRYEQYGDLDPQWPFGLLDPRCSAMRIAYEFISNHIQGIPYDLLPVLKALAELKGWEFRCMGA